MGGELRQAEDDAAVFTAESDRALALFAIRMSQHEAVLLPAHRFVQEGTPEGSLPSIIRCTERGRARLARIYRASFLSKSSSSSVALSFSLPLSLSLSSSRTSRGCRRLSVRNFAVIIKRNLGDTLIIPADFYFRDMLSEGFALSAKAHSVGKIISTCRNEYIALRRMHFLRFFFSKCYTHL